VQPPPSVDCSMTVNLAINLF
ncbi:hypothetical protein A2U01_0090717, partial [Trifolium medium]|nr:hypothetical protein [Trifolium medium]